MYTLLRMGVPCNVTAIFTGNPSTVLNLVTKADTWKEHLVRDIADGTLNHQFDIPSDIRLIIENSLEPAPKRARQLEKYILEEGKLRAEKYWPHLRIINTWTNGNCRLVLPKLEPWFKSGQPFLDFGYIASEINAADIVDPKTNGSLLAINSGFYEFSPLEEGEKPQSFLTADEVEIGKQYYIYVTTYSGLYRYDMNDVIEVVDKFHEVPVFSFLYKGKGITSLQGEKLSENQIIEAVEEATLKTKHPHEFFEAFADFEAGRYRLFIEFTPQIDESDIHKFSEAVEDALTHINMEYQSKRHTQRLKPVETIPLAPHAFERYRQMRLNEGAHDSQFKWTHLSATEREKNRLARLSSAPPPVFH